MRDLTQGSITRHLLRMSGFISVGLIVQTLYFLVDLYFVARLGAPAIAGVGAAGNVWMLGMAASQVISIGTLSLVAQGLGAKAFGDSRLAFNQAFGMSLIAAVAGLGLGYAFGPAALGDIGADPATAAAGRAYLFAFLPAVALMFPIAAMSAGLQASGVVGVPMMLQSATVVLNAVLAPVLIAGLGPIPAMGVAGAGWASSIASLVGLVILFVLFPRLQPHLRLTAAEAKPHPAVWRRIADIGLPAAGQWLLMFVIMAVIYWVIRGFGAAAQAGFGVGFRVMQSVMLPAMAVAFAAAPIAGQNFGARNIERVRAVFLQAAGIGSGLMLALTLLCQIRPEWLVAPFTGDPAVAVVASEYLRISSWNFVAGGLIFVCAGLFQGLGDTKPGLFSAATRLVTFVLPVLWLAGEPGLDLHEVWYLSVASMLLQAGVSLWLLRRLFRRRLAPLTPAPSPA